MSSNGQIFGGRYRLLNQLGKGGMGTVWRAEHIELGSLFAIKLIDEDLAQSSGVRARFRQEAKAAASLSSDHVVRTLDYGVDGETPYIVMELLEGESLDQQLKRVGKLAATELVVILNQVALALQRAHALGLVHRDLKPGNLFVTRTDTGLICVKLLDFGTAKSLRPLGDCDISQTRTGALIGSPAYMSPEQLNGVQGIDHRSDLWSLGVVAYESLVGRRPFVGHTMTDLTLSICVDPLPIPSATANVPDGFDAWFARACERNCCARFGSARELAEAFESLVSKSGSQRPTDWSDGRVGTESSRVAASTDGPMISTLSPRLHRHVHASSELAGVEDTRRDVPAPPSTRGTSDPPRFGAAAPPASGEGHRESTGAFTHTNHSRPARGHSRARAFFLGLTALALTLAGVVAANVGGWGANPATSSLKSPIPSDSEPSPALNTTGPVATPDSRRVHPASSSSTEPLSPVPVGDTSSYALVPQAAGRTPSRQNGTVTRRNPRARSAAAEGTSNNGPPPAVSSGPKQVVVPDHVYGF